MKGVDRHLGLLLSLGLSGVCAGAAQGAPTPLAQSGRALSDEPSVTERAQPLVRPVASCGPWWIVYLPDAGFGRVPVRISHGYTVFQSGTRSIFLDVVNRENRPGPLVLP